MLLVLRIIGSICLGGAGIAGSSWLNTDKIMNPVIKEVVISTNKITTLAFTSKRENSNRDYVGKLYFYNTPGSAIKCDDIKLLGIKWKIDTSEAVKSWNTLEPNIFLCEIEDNLMIANFSIPPFNANKNYYFHLSKTDKTQHRDKVKVSAAIQHADGIGTHYLWMDKALAELLGEGLLLVSCLCFVPDLLRLVFYRRSSKSD